MARAYAGTVMIEGATVSEGRGTTRPLEVLFGAPDLDAVAVLAEMARVARRGVVINDLRRGILPYLVTTAVTLALTRSSYTRHDGPASARRSYTLRELDELLHAAGLMPVSRSNPLLPRVVTAAVPM
jgi:hypothetical protein